MEDVTSMMKDGTVKASHDKESTGDDRAQDDAPVVEEDSTSTDDAPVVEEDSNSTDDAPVVEEDSNSLMMHR